MYTIKVISGKKKKEIPVGNLTWSDSVDSLGAEFSFDFPFGYYDEQFQEHLSCGDIVGIFSDNKEILRGVITEIPLGDGTYRGYDFAFYLNKNECTIQYKKVRADKAIKQLVNRYNVPIGSIASMKTTIKKVYKDKTVYDVIKDILKIVKSETDKGYRVEMEKGKLYVRRSGGIQLKPHPKYVDELGREMYIARSSNITGTRNITELKNRVTYAGTSEKKRQLKAVVRSNASVRKYGLLTQVETAENLTAAKAKTRAKNKLKRLNKVACNFTAEMMGHDDVKANRSIYFNRPEAQIKGWYRCTSCTHTVKEGKHTMSCEFEKDEDAV